MCEQGINVGSSGDDEVEISSKKINKSEQDWKDKSLWIVWRVIRDRIRQSNGGQIIWRSMHVSLHFICAELKLFSF